MKNTLKRILSVILAATMLLGVMPFAFAEEAKTFDAEQKLEEYLDSLDAETKEKMFSLLGISTVEQMSDEEALTSGMFVYVLDENNEVTITDIIADLATSEIRIPDTIEGHPVVAVAEGALSTVALIEDTTNGSPEVTALHIGKNVKTVERFINFDLKKITVDSANTYLMASDDILYDKATSQILLIPLGKEFDRFEFDLKIESDEDVEKFVYLAESLYYGINVDKFVFTEQFTDSFWTFMISSLDTEPATEEEWNDIYMELGLSFAYLLGCVNAKEFVVPDTCKFLYTDDFGALYSKDKSILIKYPIGNTDIDMYAIEEGVNLMSEAYFYSGYGLDSYGAWGQWNTVFMGSPFVSSNYDYATAYEFYAIFGLLAAQMKSGFVNAESATEEIVQEYVRQIEYLNEDLDKWYIKTAPANLTVHVPDSVMETLAADLVFRTDENRDDDDVYLHPLSGVNICVDNDVTFSEFAPGTLPAPAKVSDYNTLVQAEIDRYSSEWIFDEFDNNENISEETTQNYKSAGYEIMELVTTKARPLSKFEICDGDHIIVKPGDEPSAPEIDETVMPAPSQTTINYGDSIVLHVDESKIPAGGYVEWTSSNGNFDVEVSEDGKTCTISPDKSGNTTFTATIYDAEGNVVSVDEQEMTSNAGLWQKLIGFFKKLFNLTKVIPQAVKF